MLNEKVTTWKSWLLLTAGLLVYLALAARTLPHDNQLDLFVYRAGAQIALGGESPYETKRMLAVVIAQFPPKDANDLFAHNCGFFLPPQAIVLFTPFAKMKSWSEAESIWFFVLTLFGALCGTLAWTFGRTAAHCGTGWAIIVLVLLLNPLTLPTLVVGQTPLLFAGCIALGQYCFERDCPRMGCLLWALTFFKPHLALPFLALAAILGSWKRTGGIVLFVAALNLLGGLLTYGTLTGAFDLFGEYVDYIGSAHKDVVFNRVDQNYQILSWNRIVAALGEPAIELQISTVLAGFAVWAALIAVRLRLVAPWRDVFDRNKLDPAYLLAVTAVGSLFFNQVLASEMLLLVLLAPMILQHIDANRRRDVWALVGLLIFLMLPFNFMDQIADGLGLEPASRGRTLLRSHKCFGMGALAGWLLVRGPARREQVELAGQTI
jgi:Glycosyltransferase family 87